MALLKTSHQEMIRMSGVVLGSFEPFSTTTPAKSVKFFAKIDRRNDFFVNMHVWGKRKLILALLAA